VGKPPKVAEGAFAAAFPTAEAVDFLRRKGNFDGTVFLRFASKADAEAIANTSTVMINGRTVRLVMHGAREDPKQKEARKREELARKVQVSGLPPDLREEDLRLPFPTADVARVYRNNAGKVTGRFLLLFPTVAQAKAVVGREVEIKGVKVTPTAAGDHKPIECATTETKGPVPPTPADPPSAAKKSKKKSKPTESSPKPSAGPAN